MRKCRSGFATHDEALAWITWGDDASVDNVGPQPGGLTYKDLYRRRLRCDPHPTSYRREWRNMIEGGDKSRLFSLPLPQSRPKQVGSPKELYAACKIGEVAVWGRYHGGKLEHMPVAEWAEGMPPKDWIDLRYEWAALRRFWTLRDFNTATGRLTTGS